MTSSPAWPQQQLAASGRDKIYHRGLMFKSTTSNTAPLMNQFLSGLKSKNEDVRFKAARDLYHYVTTELREVPVEELTAFMDEFNHYIFDMISSADMSERKGAILAIESLIGVDVGNTSTRISRFANYLRNTFPSSDIEVMKLAAKAVGKLALVSGTYSTEYIDVEVKRAFEWLAASERHEGKRLAAVLVLKELAVATPTFFFQQVQQFFEVIFNAVRDPKANIREGAVKALRYALVVTAQREKTLTQTHYYNQCFEEAKQGFTGDIPLGAVKEKGVTKEDRCHGSLLVLNELLRCSNAEWEREFWELKEQLGVYFSSIVSSSSDGTTTSRRTAGAQYFLSQFFPRWKTRRQAGKRMLHKTPTTPPSAGPIYSHGGHPHAHVPGQDDSSSISVTFPESEACKKLVTQNYKEICKQILDQRTSRNQLLQQALFTILPRLAAFDKEVFCEGQQQLGAPSFLSWTMNYLISSLRSKERNEAFITIGLVSVAVDGQIKSYLPKIMEMLRSSLPGKDTPRKHQKYDPSVFICITLLSRSAKTIMKSEISDMLEPMLSTGLSPALTTALREIQIQVPHLKKEISDGLLKILSQILMSQPWRHPGMPKNLLISGSGGTPSPSVGAALSASTGI